MATRRNSALITVGLSALAFYALAFDGPHDVFESGYPDPVATGTPDWPDPDLDCDPDLLIWKRYCPDCVSNRPLELCGDAALR